MILDRLYARGVRNLDVLDVRAGAGLNVITGRNGSGKTAFLEAIHLAMRGQSFRSRESADVIASDAASLEVAGWFQAAPGAAGAVAMSRHTTVQRYKSAPRPQCRIDGEPARSLRALAEHLPCMVIGQDDARAAKTSAERRRALLDGFLFHVEPVFADAWRRYRSVLKQRNAALRAGAAHRVWDALLAEHGRVLDAQRYQHVQAISARLAESAKLCGLEEGVTLVYRRGWAAGASLEQALASNHDRDRTAGYTTAGPHRGDLSVRIGDMRMSEQASAGQAKLALIAFRHAQLSLLAGAEVVLLADDLGAELDDDRAERSLAALGERCTQVFATTPRSADLGQAFSRKTLFHVEQGALTATVSAE